MPSSPPSNLQLHITGWTIEAPPLAELGWFGIVAGEDTDGVFYLDNLVFQSGQQ